jgi:hypothetical protein
MLPIGRQKATSATSLIEVTGLTLQEARRVLAGDAVYIPEDPSCMLLGMRARDMVPRARLSSPRIECPCMRCADTREFRSPHEGPVYPG